VEERGAYSENAPLPSHYPTHNKLDGNLIKAHFTLGPYKELAQLKVDHLMLRK